MKLKLVKAVSLLKPMATHSLRTGIFFILFVLYYFTTTSHFPLLFTDSKITYFSQSLSYLEQLFSVIFCKK